MHRRDCDCSPPVAWPSPCGAMARLIDRPTDHRLPARQPAGFFVSGEFLYVRNAAMLIALLIPLILAILVYLAALARTAIARGVRPSVEAIGLGAVVNFFDTLGIGSFAPTTAWLKFRKLVPDRLIPPTMVVG